MIKEAAVRRYDEVFTGRRHSDAFRKIETGLTIGAEQGFVTDEGKFVGREEAAKIAYRCGQISVPKVTLYSEDLY